MKTFKQLGLAIILFITPFAFSQEITCDDFTDTELYPTEFYNSEGIIGYSQDETQAITLEDDAFLWVNSGDTGLYGVSGLNFDFDGTNQSVRFLVYGLFGQFDEMGFNVNGSSTIFLDGTFPMTVAGVEVDLDLSPPNVDDWEYFYLTFEGEIDEIRHELFESGIIELCVEPLVTEEGCDDFTDLALYPEDSYAVTVDMIGDIVGTTQGGTQDITIGAVGDGWLNINDAFSGLYGGTELDFAFDGTNQNVRFLVYGWVGDGTTIGFSVNESTFITFDESFPMVIDGISVDMDLSPDDYGSWESFYLTLSGEIDVVSHLLFESGIQELCVEPFFDEDDCDNFLDTDEWYSDEAFGEDDILGYTQDGTYAVTCSDGHGYVNTFGEIGISIGTGIVDFEFSGDNQDARFTVYHVGLDENTGFSVNGSPFTYFDASFPITIADVIVDLDTSPEDPDGGDDIWGMLSYLTFTGEISDISIYALEGGITELCVEEVFVDEEGCDNFFNSDEWFTAADFGEDDILGYTQDGTYAVTCTDGHGYVNTFGDIGISIGDGTVDFEMSGANQTARFTIYHNGLSDWDAFSVNGSSYTTFDAAFPVTVDGVVIDIDTSPADPDMDDDIWGDLSYLTFTGELDLVSLDMLEGGITELCVDESEIDDTGIADLTNDQLTLYPNPANNQTTIKSEKRIQTVQMYSISGELLANINGAGSQQIQLDLTAFESGIYLIHVITEDGSQIVQKLVKE